MSLRALFFCVLAKKNNAWQSIATKNQKHAFCKKNIDCHAVQARLAMTKTHKTPTQKPRHKNQKLKKLAHAQKNPPPSPLRKGRGKSCHCKILHCRHCEILQFLKKVAISWQSILFILNCRLPRGFFQNPLAMTKNTRKKPNPQNLATLFFITNFAKITTLKNEKGFFGRGFLSPLMPKAERRKKPRTLFAPLDTLLVNGIKTPSA